MRGKWTRLIPTTSALGADQSVEEPDMEMEILEDEVHMHAMQDQRGATKYTYKVSVDVLLKSNCVFCRMGPCR